MGQEEKGELRRCYLLDFGMCKAWKNKGVLYPRPYRIPAIPHKEAPPCLLVPTATSLIAAGQHANCDGRQVPRHAEIRATRQSPAHGTVSISIDAVIVSSSSVQDHARKDDIESWFYMLVDFCNASLPWKVATDLTEVYCSRIQ